MVTLLINRVQGKRARSCSARCYDAKTSPCYCICMGANHGVGMDKAVGSTLEKREEYIEKGLEVKV